MSLYNGCYNHTGYGVLPTNLIVKELVFNYLGSLDIDSYLTNTIIKAAEAATDRAIAAAMLSENTDVAQFQLDLESQKLDTGITTTAKNGGIERSQAEKNTDVISIKDFVFDNTGVVDSTIAINSAIAYVKSKGATLDWSDGVYLANGNITDFHAVRHTGTGVIKRGENIFKINPIGGHNNYFYVSAFGDNSNDGLSPDFPFREINYAVQKWVNLKEVINLGNWTIKVDSGNYKGGINIPQGLITHNYLSIIGKKTVYETGALVDLALNLEGKVGVFAVGDVITGSTSGGKITITKVVTAKYGEQIGRVIAVVGTVTSGKIIKGETITATGKSASISGVRLVPTVRILNSLDTAQSRGIQAIDNLKLWLEDVKIEGFTISETISRNTMYQRRNVHSETFSSVGVDIDNRSTYFVYGGIIEDCPNLGVQELFTVVRSYSRDDEVLIRNCATGINAKENCSGHLDDVRIEDCGSAVVFHAWTTANMRLAKLRRNSTAAVLVNSEMHNESSIDYGTGLDASKVSVLPLGSSSEVSELGWTGSTGEVVLRKGYRPLIMLDREYTPITHTGSTSEFYLTNFYNTIRPRSYQVKGRSFTVNMVGKLNSTTTGTVRLLFRLSTLMGEVTIPIGTPAQAFTLDCKCTTTADGNFQHVLMTLRCGSYTQIYTTNRTLDLGGDAYRSVQIGAILSNAADSVSSVLSEVWG